MPFIETRSGVRIHYESMGEGRPLVFIHGWSMSGRVWKYQAEALASDYRVVTIDLRGHGESSGNVSYSFDDFSSDIVELFAQLDLHGAVLAGWSMGVQVILQGFDRLKDRIAGLVLVCGTPRFTAADDWPFGLPPEESRGMKISLKRNFTKTMGEFFKGMFADNELSHAQYNRIARDIVMGSRLPEPETSMKTLESLNSEDQRQMLDRIDAPVLLIHGSEDKITLPGASLYMSRMLKHANVKIFDGSGHAPFLSRPEEFNAILRLFLEDVYGSD